MNLSLYTLSVEEASLAQVRIPEADSKKPKAKLAKDGKVATCLTYIGSVFRFTLPVPLVFGQAPNSWH